MVKWSACLPSFPLIRVQIPLTSAVFAVKFVFEKTENKQKEAGVGPFKKDHLKNILIFNHRVFFDRHRS